MASSSSPTLSEKSDQEIVPTDLDLTSDGPILQEQNDTMPIIVSDFAGDDLTEPLPLTFETRRRRVAGKQKVIESPGSHEVKFSVTIAIAVSSGGGGGGGIYGGGGGTNRSEMERRRSNATSVGVGEGGARAHAFFHIEYQLLPPGIEKEGMKTDVVFYGSAAKVFPERCEARHMKTWTSGTDETWFAWVQNFSVTVNNELLTQLSDYTLRVRVWDTKEKCSTRARFDRPKGFRFPAPRPGQDPDSIDGVKPCVMRLSNAYARDPVAIAMGADRRPLPHEVTLRPVLRPPVSRQSNNSDSRNNPQVNIRSPSVQDVDCELYAVAKPGGGGGGSVGGGSEINYGQLDKLASNIVNPTPSSVGKANNTTSNKMQEVLTVVQTSSGSRLIPGGVGVGGGGSGGGGGNPLYNNRTTLGVPINSQVDDDAASSTDLKMENRRLMRQEAMDREAYQQNGRCYLDINMATLFVNRNVLERISDPTNGSIEDMFIQISLNSDLLSEQQKGDLNPLIIRLKSASHLPQNPLGFSYLREQCRPVYCQYQFLDRPSHVTVSRPHGPKVVWNDIQVVLTGLMDKVKLFESLAGAQLIMEIHDRERLPKKLDLSPTLFGNDADDMKICNVAALNSKSLSPSPSSSSNETHHWNPYGIAKVDFEELLSGQKSLHLSLPITPCPLPGAGEVLGDPKSSLNQHTIALPMGDFMDSGSTLKVDLELAYSLRPLTDCPDVMTFGRIVIMHSLNDDKIIQILRGLIRSINIQALDLTNQSAHVIKNKLRETALNSSQVKDCKFDVITGFHLDDGQMHLFILEGPKEGAIEAVWKGLAEEDKRGGGGLWSKIRVLYDCHCGFSNRYYPNLGLHIAHMRLHRPLVEILAYPLLYVRDILPHDCYLGLTKIGQLLQCNSLKSAIKNDLLPTEHMMILLQKEFCQPKFQPSQTTFDDEEEENEGRSRRNKANESATITQTTLNKGQGMIKGLARWTKRLDNDNLQFMASSCHKNFLRENTAFIRNQSHENKQKRIQSCPAEKIRANVHPAHNYSIQTLNSTEMAKAIVRQKMLPNRSYTYSGDFGHSGTVSPVGGNDQENYARMTTTTISASGNKTPWIYPGLTSALEDNKPHLPLDEASRDNLYSYKWEENRLHTASLQPTLPERCLYPWAQRHRDVNLYFRVPHTFGKEPPTIMSAGDIKAFEEALIQQKEKLLWQDKLAVDSIRPSIHRCLPATEFKEKGRESSNQLDRLKGLRKDASMKGDQFLRVTNSEDLPALSVTMDIYRDFVPISSPLMPGEQKNKTLLRSFLPRNNLKPMKVATTATYSS